MMFPTADAALPEMASTTGGSIRLLRLCYPKSLFQICYNGGRASLIVCYKKPCLVNSLSKLLLAL